MSASVLDARFCERIRVALNALQGWCTLEKATFLAEQIVRNRYKVAVEVGVFGGRSLIPMALAVAHTGGEVFGVEVWNNEVAVEVPMEPRNDEWWSTLDIARVKRAFLRYLAASDLAAVTRIIELPSWDAARAFDTPRWRGKIDFVHIDGSHAEAQALGDVQRWCRVVRPGGMIVLDDIGWGTVQKARNYLMRRCASFIEVADTGQSGYGAFTMGRKSSPMSGLESGNSCSQTLGLGQLQPTQT